jgi:nucleoid-associated protein YgaU
VILGLSRNLLFAAIAAAAVTGGGLWYVLSEDEPGAPAVQQETAATEEVAVEESAVEESRAETTTAEETATRRTIPEEPAMEESATEEPATEETATRETESEDTAREAAAEAAGEIEELFVQEPEPTTEAADGAARMPADTGESITAGSPAQDEPASEQPPGLAFDIIRVEPTGEAVIAGRGAPDARVALLRNGAVHDETMSDASGNFVFIPEPFPAGTSDVTLRATGRDGRDLVSQESLTIVVDADRQRQPMVARTAPGQPTEVLSRPEAEPARVAEAATTDERPTEITEEPAEERAETVASLPGPAESVDAARQSLSETPREATSDTADETTETPVADSPDEPARESAVASVDATPEPDEPVDARAGVRIVAVEAETGGGLFVSGEAEAQAAIRLYLNDTLVTQAEADDSGDVSFAIRRGVRAGRYQVRLDDVDPATGTVLSRAEVGFTVPEAVAALPAQQPEPAPAGTAQPAAESEAMPAEPPVAEPDEPATIVADAPAADPAPVGEEVARDVPSPAAETAEAMAEATAEDIVTERGSARPEATVTVPELATALVERGDSLWRISRQVYGRGIRYTEIFEANQDQIRNPNLIYPGQVFVLPPDAEAAQDGPDAEAPAAQ